MNPQDAQPLDPKTRVANTLSVTQPGERTIFTVKRHPIGIFSTYVMCGLFLIAIAVLAFVVAPRVFASSGTAQVVLTGALLFVIVAAVCVAFALIATKIYWGNSWVLTTDSITQVTQASLFRRQSSQLELDNMEDVTAEQNGVLAHMFNYGVLRVETAGESSKFMFAYCPNPNYYAQQVLAAREAFREHDHAEAGAYQPAPPVAPPVTPVPPAQPVPQHPAPEYPPQPPQPPAGY